jgi:hypothetical protein
MDSELTLKLDRTVIKKAKDYAEHRGISLSKMVEGYFLGLTQGDRHDEIQPTGVVAELAGLLVGSQAETAKEDYAEHLVKKYS